MRPLRQARPWAVSLGAAWILKDALPALAFRVGHATPGVSLSLDRFLLCTWKLWDFPVAHKLKEKDLRMTWYSFFLCRFCPKYEVQ